MCLEIVDTYYVCSGDVNIYVQPRAACVQVKSGVSAMMVFDKTHRSRQGSRDDGQRQSTAVSHVLVVVRLVVLSSLFISLFRV